MPAAALTLDDLRDGGKAAVAGALSAIESLGGTGRHAGLLDAALDRPLARRIGLTGPPGVGKSTLTNRLVRCWRDQGVSVAVIAVDPSSQLSGGALLGDRTRIATDPEDSGVLVRSFAARDRLGGLSDAAIAATHLLAALYDRVIVESVGIGQSESDLAHAVDTLVLCVQPASGDSLQFMKAGIMERPDILVVTKADMEREARRALADLTGALSLAAPADPRALPLEALALSAATGEGVQELIAACDAHWTALCSGDQVARLRSAQAGHWLADAVRRRYGEAGLRVLSDAGRLSLEAGLYHGIGQAFAALSVKLR